MLADMRLDSFVLRSRKASHLKIQKCSRCKGFAVRVTRRRVSEARASQYSILRTSSFKSFYNFCYTTNKSDEIHRFGRVTDTSYHHGSLESPGYETSWRDNWWEAGINLQINGSIVHCGLWIRATKNRSTGSFKKKRREHPSSQHSPDNRRN